MASDGIDHAKAITEKGTAEIIDLAKAKKVGLRAAADYVRHTPKAKQVADPAAIKGSGTRTPKRDEARSAIRAKLEKGEAFTIPELMTELSTTAQPLMLAAAHARGRLENDDGAVDRAPGADA